MFRNRYGRINRPTYFVCFAILMAVWTAVAISQVRIPGEVLAFVVAVPRLHDIGKSAWWAAAVIAAELLVVFVALPFALAVHEKAILELAAGFFVMIAWGLMVLLGCIRGQEGVNKYGEAPPPGVSFRTYRMTKSAAEAEAEAF